MGLNATLALSVSANHTKTLDLAEGKVALSKIYQALLTSGTGVGQADLIFHDTRTLSASATENLDLSGVLTDAFGATLAFVKVKALIFVAAAANTNNVIVGGDVTNTFFPMFGLETDSLILRPGTTFALICGVGDSVGYAVTGGTADLLKVTNSAGSTSVSYDVYVFGTSA